MGCGEVRQVRLGEMIEFKWDSSGSLVSNPLDESSNINFFQLMVPETLSGATGETTLVLTIDVVIRS